MKIKLKDLILVGSIIAAGYLAYKYFLGEKTPSGTGQTGSITTAGDILGNTAGTIGQGLINAGSGLNVPATGNEAVDFWGNLAGTLWNFATGVASVNPFTAPVMPVYDYATEKINEYMQQGTTQPQTETTAPQLQKVEAITPHFVRSSPAPTTQILSLPAKIQEGTDNLVVPVIPETATPNFAYAIRNLYPPQVI